MMKKINHTNDKSTNTSKISRRSFIKKSGALGLGLLLSGPFATRLIANNTKTPKKLKNNNEKQNTVHLGKQIDYLSGTGMKAKEIILDGERVGVALLMTPDNGYKTQAMFVSARQSTAFFKKNKLGQYIPDINAIKKYMDDYNRDYGTKRKINLIVNGPTFKRYGSDILSGLNYDNGVLVGNNSSIDGNDTAGRGIAYISGKKLHFSHTSELTQADINELVKKKADIFTMSSLKRNGNINYNSSLWKHKNAHSLVQFTDGSVGEIILNNTSPDIKKNVIKGLDIIDRALYSDSDAGSDYLDGMRVSTKDGLKYTHPDIGDIFKDTHVAEPKMVEDNMPGLIIFYSDKK